ncbi:MAG: transcriptional regulator, TetR family [Proteobacteria bacterium]|nr:transcriptional regulator, TetR family [Pseudomonadota bacterium]
MRMITSQAEANLAAVNYHFGSKEELFHQVFHRRLAQLNRDRLDALDRLEQQALGKALDPRQILEAFFASALQMAADQRHGGANFMRLLGRTYTASGRSVAPFIASEYEEVMRRYLAASYRALPDMPKREIAWRLHFMTGAATYAMSGVDALALLGGEDDGGLAQVTERLISFFLGGLSAPVAGQ